MAPSTPPGTPSSAVLWLWAGQAIYRGPSLRLNAHSTAVDCLAVGVDAPFTLETGGGTHVLRSALIPPRRVHRLVADGDQMLFCYLDPASRGARACRERMTRWHNEFGLDHRAEAALAAAATQTRPDPCVLAGLAGTAPVPAPDDRVAEAMAALLAHPARDIPADRFAAAAHLSESRFLHLFAAQAGTSFRRYRLWARMLGAARAVAEGANLTVASVHAGFASPSHFSDAFRTLFGLSATTLLATGVRIVVLDEAEGIESGTRPC
ncbi:helix-turn-helix transcriptional regulator [Nocardia beijingensis]|uniref:AraC family transcriptional regulator n=1 Tax=Nocardia beijingensis TaxID=95162 RepID=UPI0018952993|nr:AraC family transcriptional regulator [Nocardia beijingensis]MBF6467279.1 helix-turn-helix transcriptional regulator [Nocardia beijingensis]